MMFLSWAIGYSTVTAVSRYSDHPTRVVSLALTSMQMHLNHGLPRYPALLSLLLALLSMTGCSPIKTLNALVPDDGYQLASGLTYGDLPRQQLDVYRPSAKAADTAPVVVFFYGGGWEAGRRQDYKFVAEALTSRGMVVVIPDYRVYPQAVFPEFIHDAARAVSWAKTHAAEYGGDPQRLFLAGHSAGAHIAAMLALDAHYLAAENLEPAALRGMIGLAGPYDFLPLKSRRLQQIFGPEEQWPRSQPINYVQGGNPPMLLLVGENDGTVWPRNTYNLAKKIEAARGSVEVARFPGWGHADMVAKLAKPLRGDGALLNRITQFIEAHAATQKKVAN